MTVVAGEALVEKDTGLYCWLLPSPENTEMVKDLKKQLKEAADKPTVDDVKEFRICISCMHC